MMKYARVEDGKVVEVIDFNPKNRFEKHIEEQFIECLETTKQHDIYKDGKFEIKELTQQELNQQITNDINKSNNEAMVIFDEIVEWAVEKGFILSEQKKELMNNRKEKRELLK